MDESAEILYCYIITITLEAVASTSKMSTKVFNTACYIPHTFPAGPGPGWLFPLTYLGSATLPPCGKTIYVLIVPLQ